MFFQYRSIGTKDGNWTSWSLWTHCSTSCNGGVQQRRRYCHHPAPRYGGSNCTGSNIDTRTCNEQICKGLCSLNYSLPKTIQIYSVLAHFSVFICRGIFRSRICIYKTSAPVNTIMVRFESHSNLE